MKAVERGNLVDARGGTTWPRGSKELPYRDSGQEQSCCRPRQVWASSAPVSAVAGKRTISGNCGGPADDRCRVPSPAMAGTRASRMKRLPRAYGYPAIASRSFGDRPQSLLDLTKILDRESRSVLHSHRRHPRNRVISRQPVIRWPNPVT